MNDHADLIKTSVKDNILHIQLNRPEKLNVLNEALLKQLIALFQKAKLDAAIKGILLSGAGKAFCAGADIRQLASLNGASGAHFARFGQSVFNELEWVSKPSIAALHGYVFGGGCELALAATLRIAADTAQFSQPEIKLGLIPGFGGTQRLARLIGKAKALELCLTGEKIDAKEALALGLVNAIYPEEEVVARSFELLRQITKYSMTAVQGVINSIHHGLEMSLASALELEATHFGVCCSTADKKEGTSAFLEKRSPIFSGE